MPQMSSMDWLVLMFFFIFIYLMFLVNIYFMLKLNFLDYKVLILKQFFLNKWY
uniref:ATP synthase F0 subunit 8 n=1 Tax=Apanteles gelechiidivoris TaxID=1911542 RepID=UPI00286C9C51|nr:ATP synthase F0 subunit 8 [Apanteles gelechiidivoris]WKW91663.1 ATP synthase F0 subunit 8 [Apanteles gelechiidivoris]WLN31481.1 ATP synthase F0 subunit 8 [Apanteles gelechiidivoris]